LRDPSGAADHLADALEFGGHARVQLDDIIECVGDLAVDSRQSLR